MTIKKVDGPIVCDTIGCGNLVEKKLTFVRTGTSTLLCGKCLRELRDALIKEKDGEKESK